MLRFLCLLALAAVALAYRDYSGEEVLSVFPLSTSQLKTLQKLEHEPDLQLDFWSYPRQLRHPALIRVQPQQKEQFKKVLHENNIPFGVKYNDLNKLFNDAKEKNDALKKKSKQGKAIDLEQYHSLAEIYDYLENLTSSTNVVVKTQVLGQTVENRDIRVVTISNGQANQPQVFIESGIHAREWISPAVTLQFIDRLVNQYGSDDTVTQLLDAYDWALIVVTNPDGYEYSRETDRAWRKNRSRNNLCYGVDCNRNFDSAFGGEGTSNQPCQETYHGPSAFSEAESAAVRDYIEANPGKVEVYLSLHSYSQLWMFPYGYADVRPPNFNELNSLSATAVSALTALYGTEYQYGTIAETIYLAAGSSVDWVYDAAGVTIAFAVELRDTGRYGFELPANQIAPTSEETWAGFTAALKQLQALKKSKQ